LDAPKANHSPLGLMATDEIFSFDIDNVWIGVKVGISHRPNTPVENPTIKRFDKGWKVAQTTFVPG
jgi:hypothetical protein